MARESKRNRDAKRFGASDRIYDLFLADYDQHVIATNGKPDQHRKHLAENIVHCPVFEATAVNEYLENMISEKEFDAFKSCPSLKLPYPMIFIEFSSNSLELIGDSFGAFGKPKFGCMLLELKKEVISRSPKGFAKTFSSYASKNNIDYAHCIFGTIIMNGVRQGRLVANGPLAHFACPISREGCLMDNPRVLFLGDDKSDDFISAALKIIGRVVTPLLLTVSFLNCKNLVHERKEPDIATNKERKKNKLRPHVRFNIINIDPMKTVLRTEGGIETNGLKKALHICRGHFKTYGDSFMGRKLEKPLTFWAPSHVRGSVKEGVVVSDYKVNAPKSGRPGG